MRGGWCGLLWIVGFGAVACGCGTAEPDREGRLEISEFLYRTGVDTLEWIELRNAGSADAPLAGVSVSGAGFSFPLGTPALPPGTSLVIANSADLFARSHPGVPLFGVFSGRLDDQGERLKLESGGRILFEVRYDDREPWPQAAAWGGSSLVYLGGDPRLAASWAASSRAGGFPGGSKSTAAERGVFVSEVRPADVHGRGFVEICSEAVSEVAIGGWLLAETSGSGLGAQLPPGLSIAPGTCVVLRQSPAAGEIGWGTLLPDRSGGHLVLFERTSDGQPTGAAHGLAWDALPEGASAIRSVDGASWIQDPPAPGVPDSLGSLPMVGIVRVCYHPASGPEHLVLRNMTDSVVHLGDADSSLAWRFDGLDLRFSAADSLAPGGFMVLVPASETTPGSFRSAHSIPSGVPVAAYAGALDDAGERIALERPLVATTAPSGKLKWARQAVDAAAWIPADPWPARAGGGGACLERVDPRIPGESARAWTAVENRPEVLP